MDRFRSHSWYTIHLLRALKEVLPGGGLYAYGSKEDNIDPNLLVLKVWSPCLYPLQISLRAMKDRVNLVHIQFEFYTFGSPQYSVLLLPLIVVLKALRIKTAVTLHGPIVPQTELMKVLQVLRPTKSRFPVILLSVCITAVYRIVGKLSDVIVVHSKASKQSLAGFGIDSRKIHVLPHGVPYGVKKTSKSRSQDAANILYFGTLSPRKGVEYLLYAFSRVLQVVPTTKLIVAGKPLRRYSVYERFLKKTVSRLGLTNNVEFLGYVPDREIPALFEKAIIVVFPYIFSVGACGPLSFAVQFGKPVVATQIEYFREFLLHGKDAILVPPKDLEELTMAMIKLLTNQGLRIGLAKNIETKGRDYSWNKVARLTLQLYIETTSRKAM